MSTSNPVQRITIRNESQAIALIQRALSQQLEGSELRLDFKNWPTLELRYTGEKFDGTITPGVAQAIVELQLALNRIYAFAVKGTTNLRALTEEERNAIQVVVKIEKGSTLLDIFLNDWSQKLASELVNKMTGTEIAVTVLGSALFVSAGWVLKHHLQSRSEEKKLGIEKASLLQLSQQETERLKLVTRAAESNPVVRTAQVFSEHTNAALLRSAFDADGMTVQGGFTVDSNLARQAYRGPRRQSVPVQLNGTYTVKSFAWDADGMAAKVRIVAEGSGQEYTAELSVNALTADQKLRFKDATFEQARVHLTVNATELDGEITTAKIVSVDEQPPKRFKAI